MNTSRLSKEILSVSTALLLISIALLGSLQIPDRFLPGLLAEECSGKTSWATEFGVCQAGDHFEIWYRKGQQEELSGEYQGYIHLPQAHLTVLMNTEATLYFLWRGGLLVNSDQIQQILTLYTAAQKFPFI